MIQSVDRAIRVLTALQGARRMSLSELAARLDLAPSTTHGIVRSLVEHGMVVQERGSSRYQLGPAVLRLGNVYLDTLELRSKAIPWAEDLARRTGLAVRTGVLLIDDVVIIHHEPRPDGSRQMPEVGIVIPVHASALGKALLAFLAEDEKRVLTSGELRSMTGETVTVARTAARPAGRGPLRRHRPRTGRGGDRGELAGEPDLRLLRRGRGRHRRRHPVRSRPRAPPGQRPGPGNRARSLPRAWRSIVASATSTGSNASVGVARTSYGVGPPHASCPGSRSSTC